jgi:predicted MFS family arabinose efflux permease
MSRLALLVAGAFFMEFLDGTIIVPALPRMAESLGTNPVDLHIGITAYLLTVAVFILPGGWAADRFGARAVFTTAVGVFTLGSLLCGLADSTGAFVAARVLQGLGGAMMVPVGRLAVLRTTAKPDLLRAIALLTWPGLTAPLGGFLAEHFTWRMIFWVNLPLGALGMILALRLVPAAAGAARRPFDGVGFVLAAAWCLCATVALDMLGEGAGAWGAIALLAAVAGAAGPLLWRHLRRHPHPLLDTAPFATPTFRATMLTGTLMRTLIGTLPFLLPLLFQLGYGRSAVEAGLLLVLFAGNLGIKPLTTPILRRVGFRRVLVSNGLLQAAAMVGFALLPATVPLPVLLALLAVAGASRSLQFTALNTLAFADVPQPAMGPANTWFSVAFQLSIGIGVAVGAVALRLASLAAGVEQPGLAQFHVALAAIALGMAGSALAALGLARDAGAAITARA